MGLATLGWQVENGISVGATLGLGPWRDLASSDGLEQWTLRQGWIAASLGYNLPLGYHTLVGARLSGGPVWLDGNNRSQAPGEVPTQIVRAAAATAWLPELKIERVTGNLGLGLGVGWLFARFSEVRGTLPNGRENFLYHANGSPVVIDHSGLHLRAYLRLYLDPPL